MRKLSENEIKQVSGGDGNDGQAELIVIGAIAGTFLSPGIGSIAGAYVGDKVHSWATTATVSPSMYVAIGYRPVITVWSRRRSIKRFFVCRRRKLKSLIKKPSVQVVSYILYSYENRNHFLANIHSGYCFFLQYPE